MGQFFTPYSIANFMASLFSNPGVGACRLLDPGAGVGVLSAAFIERWSERSTSSDSLHITAFEIDAKLHEKLELTIEQQPKRNVSYEVIGDDFIEEASLSLLGFRRPRLSFTHAILNPPYKKISSSSRHRQFLRKAKIETVNLYSGFLALAIRTVEPGGEIVAIIPRSFCNGPYYKPFRKILLDETAIRRIHLFESRNSAFKDDGVLQENVIIHLEKRATQGDVTISTSTDGMFADIQCHEARFSSIVQPEDGEQFIHIPTSPGESEIELSSEFAYSLDDLGIQVSTGPVVDFRVRNHLRSMPEPGSVPLIYPAHFVAQQAIWPRKDHKKPNALMLNDQTRRSLYPCGFYCVVRRFSSKEENRRVVAHFVCPSDFAFSALGFENHLNVFHSNKEGIDEFLARGLTAFLNSTAVDDHLRRFNGHTQVNATDLRSLKYPSKEWLIRLGWWSKQHQAPTQEKLDCEVRKSA